MLRKAPASPDHSVLHSLDYIGATRTSRITEDPVVPVRMGRSSTRIFRKGVIITCWVVTIGLISVRAYFEVVPRGAEFEPWILGRVHGPILKSPDGRRVVRVYFNVAGAAHSGNRRTWIVERSWLTGRYVVAEGYVGQDVEEGLVSVPLEWGEHNEIDVSFRHSRYSE